MHVIEEWVKTINRTWKESYIYVITYYSARARGKVIGVGMGIYIFIYIYMCTEEKSQTATALANKDVIYNWVILYKKGP